MAAVMAGIRRTHGTAQEGKAPLLPADLRLMVAELDDGTGSHVKQVAL